MVPGHFRVRDLDAMLAQLRAKGADVAAETQDMEGVGRFGWVTDPEGNRVELWQPAWPRLHAGGEVLVTLACLRTGLAREGPRRDLPGPVLRDRLGNRPDQAAAGEALDECTPRAAYLAVGHCD